MPFRFEDVKCYTDKEYGIILDWAYCTKGRSGQIIEHIESVLQHADCVELWHLWLGDDELPIIKTNTVSIADVTSEDIQEFDKQEAWRTPINVEDRPTFYCLKVVR